MRILNFLGATAVSTASAVILLIAPASYGAIIFQTDFSGVNGTGNTNVTGTVGGTATLIGTAQASIDTAAPMANGAGGYLEIAEPGTAITSGVDITGSASSNPFNSWIGTPVSVSGTDYVNLNGAFDFFFRTNLSSSSWNTGKSYILNMGGNSPDLSLALYTNNGGIKIQIGSSSTGNIGVTAGNVYHIAGTVSTDPATGGITLDLYEALGDTAISSTGSPSVTKSLGTFLATTYTGNFGNGPILFGAHNYGSTNVMNNDFDSLRIYDSVPATFDTLAVPEPNVLLALTMQALILVGLGLMRRRSGPS